MHTRKPRLIITSLSLAGLCACDFERAPDDDDVESFRKETLDPKEPVEVEGPILIGPPIPIDLPVEDSPAACFTAFHLVLHHGDGTQDVSDSVGGLAKYARAGDLLELDFKLDPACLPKYGPRLTLISYATSGIYGLKPAVQPHAYDVHTANFGPKGGQLTARLPNCFFEVDLAFGEPLPPQDGPENGYEAQQRLIARASGGKNSCGAVPRLVVEQFEPVGPGWGDAPIATNFGWRLTTPAKTDPKLTCTFDLDGDGTVDEVRSPCSTDTSDTKPGLLPYGKFEAPGKHRPELVVSDGTRRVWAATTVHANKLEYRPDVHFPEQVAGFQGAELVVHPAPLPSELTLKYASPEQVPQVQVGEVVVGFAGDSGYMLRVEKAEANSEALLIVGAAADLQDVVAGGHFGVRDLQVATANARCVSPECANSVVTPVDLPPGFGGGDVNQPALLDAMQDGVETKFGVKIAVPLGTKERGEVEAFGGVLIKNFEFDATLFGIPKADIDLGPVFEFTITAKAAIGESFEFGTYYLGTLPAPLPLTLMYTPRLDLETALKFSGKVSVRAPMRLRKDATGWAHSFDPVLAGNLQSIDIDSGVESGLEIKATSVHQIELVLGLLSGPYVGPAVGLAIKGMFDQNCQYCLSVNLEGGGELGWKAPWPLGDLFEPIKVTLLEVEIAKDCPFFSDECTPPPPPGGSWGDVHLVSFDGLLLDFQAGGEFVLVRATDGLPFEIQTRQEPMKLANFGGTDLSLSVNTAVAMMVDGHRLGFYTRHPEPVLVDGQPPVLGAGQPLALGQGSLTLDADGRTYTITHPSGEVVTLTRQLAHGQVRAHFNIKVNLPPARAGSVEGLLGDADGDTTNDIALPGGQPFPQPVAFDDLYWAPVNFADAWKVAPGASLFDYAGGATPATFHDAPPYIQMPATLPPATMPHVQLAQQLCAACPDNLEGTCMTDVGFTGDPALALACTQAPGEPVAENPAQTKLHGVYPLPKAQFDCARNELVFRAPGAAQAHLDPTQASFIIDLAYWEEWEAFPPHSGWHSVEHMGTSNPPPGGWGEKFTCRDLGTGWGECTVKLKPESSPCIARDTNKYRWQVRANPYPYTLQFTHEFFGA
ncbi:MAG: VWD domain-containing protein [Nannocystis sp.]|nr:VWD domain-containing protein [Nannocystis sp.]MBA3548619.1 VWD domain-containing protein [Nannocystis sp.]